LHITGIKQAKHTSLFTKKLAIHTKICQTCFHKSLSLLCRINVILPNQSSSDILMTH
jgi:hypothetical protein